MAWLNLHMENQRLCKMDTANETCGGKRRRAATLKTQQRFNNCTVSLVWLDLHKENQGGGLANEHC